MLSFDKDYCSLVQVLESNRLEVLFNYKVVMLCVVTNKTRC